MNEKTPQPSLERWQQIVALLAEKVFGWQRWTCSDMPGLATLFPPESGVQHWSRCDIDTPLSPSGWAIAAMHLQPTLDTLWQAEERLTAEERRRYAHFLRLLIGDEGHFIPYDFDLMHASVERKAVALLLVFGVDLRETR